MGEPKSATAFRTISEVAAELGIAPHILRYWETRFPQLRPLTRAGNRRYYRPEDVALLRQIQTALDRDGYTIKGVQKLLAARPAPIPQLAAPPPPSPPTAQAGLIDELIAVRDALRAALADGS